MTQLTKAQKAIKDLHSVNRHVGQASLPQYPQPPSQLLLDLLGKLYTTRLPKDLATLSMHLQRAHTYMTELSTQVQSLISDFQDERIVSALQLTPPNAWGRLAWGKDEIIQRRVKHAAKTVESFQRTIELSLAFDGAETALESYQKSLGLYEVSESASTVGVTH